MKKQMPKLRLKLRSLSKKTKIQLAVVVSLAAVVGTTAALAGNLGVVFSGDQPINPVEPAPATQARPESVTTTTTNPQTVPLQPAEGVGTQPNGATPQSQATTPQTGSEPATTQPPEVPEKPSQLHPGDGNSVTTQPNNQLNINQ